MTSSVRLLTTAADLASIEAGWNALSEGMPLRSYDWLATWWNHYGAAGDDLRHSTVRRLFVLAVYRNIVSNENRANQSTGGCLLGLAPWYLENVPVKGNVLRWLGCGEVCTDHLSIICRPSHRAEVAAAIADALTAQFDEWDQLDLTAVDVDDPAVDQLLAQLEARECVVSSHEADACWALDLPPTWEDYLSAVSKIASQTVAPA